VKTVEELRAEIEHLHTLARLIGDPQALQAIHDQISELERRLSELEETSDGRDLTGIGSVRPLD
jgi:hypothetical protein